MIRGKKHRRWCSAVSKGRSRLFCAALILFSHQAGAEPSEAPNPEDKDWYQIEVLLFERLNPDDYHVDPPHFSLPEKRPGQWRYFVHGTPVTLNQVQVTPKEENQLFTEYWDKLARSKNLRPVFTTSWKDYLPTGTHYPPIQLTIDLFDQKRNLPEVYTGWINVRRERYLHLELDLSKVLLKERKYDVVERLHDDLIQPWAPLASLPALNAQLSPLPSTPSIVLPPSEATHAEEKRQSPLVVHEVYRKTESRKMRSNELHYLDFPLFGLLVQALPTTAPAIPEQKQDPVDDTREGLHAGAITTDENKKSPSNVRR